MGIAIRAIASVVTNPSTTVTATTAASGDSLVVQNFNPNSSAWLVNAWALGATAGIFQIHSPRLHDDNRGIRYKYLAANSIPPWQQGQIQRLYPQDTLVAEMTGGASEVDGMCMLQYFDDLPGSAVDVRMPDQIKAQTEDLVTVETTHTIGATAGQWSGSVALNSGSALLKANRNYALLGFACDTMITSVGILGPDTANQRLAGPGTTDRITTRSWYEDLSRTIGKPCCPVINASNQGSTFVTVLSNATSGTVIVQHAFALLK